MNIIAFLKHKRRVWKWIQILILAACLMWFVQDLARQTVAVSLISLLWGVKLLLYTLPQPLIWIAFLVIGGYILVKSLIPSQLFQSQPQVAASETHGKVEKLADLIRLANQSEYSRRKLAQYLTTVTLDMLEFQRQESREQLYHALQTGSLEIDQELRNYFQTALTKKNASSSTGLWAKIHERFAAQKQRTLLNLEPVTIIRFLEDQLEGEHEHEGL